MAPTAHIPISKPGHFGIDMSTAPMRKKSKSFNPHKFDYWRHFASEKLAGEMFTLDMDEDAAGHIRANDCGFAFDVHDFNFEQWQRNMSKRHFEEWQRNMSKRHFEEWQRNMSKRHFEEWQRNMSKRRFNCEDVMEYIVETFNWKRSVQAKYQPGDIFQVQDDVTPTMRYDCVNWLVTVTRKMDFALETFCLAVNFLDRFLCLQPIQGNCLQLVGLVAFFVASKQEEVDPPEVSELVTLCGGAFPPDQIQNMEKIMLARLNFELVAPTPGFFLQLIVEIDDDLDWPVDLARHLVEMALEDPILAQLRPLRIANGVRQIIKAYSSSVLISVSINCPKCDPYCEKDDFGFIETCFENLVKLLLQCEY